MIEHIRIHTGSPKEVQKKLIAAFAEHPNTDILATSTCLSSPSLPAVEAEATAPAKGKGKSTAGTLPPIPEPTLFLTVITGRRFP
jgi:hypothetical protein